LNRYTQDNSELEAGWKSTLQVLKKIGAPIVYLVDTPYPTIDAPSCVSAALGDWAKCDFSKSISLRRDPLLERPLAKYLTAVIKINQYLCPGNTGRCPSVLDHVLLYRDDSHVSDTAMTALTRVVMSEFKAAGVRSKPSAKQGSVPHL
jgi:hypothetical protein